MKNAAAALGWKSKEDFSKARFTSPKTKQVLPESYIKAALASYAYAQGDHYGGIDNMLAIAFVIRNRVIAGWYGGDWMEAISDAGRVAGNEPRPAKPINLRETRLRRFLERIDGVYDGSEVDVYTVGGIITNTGYDGTTGALYYCDTSEDIRPWFKENILQHPEDHPRTASVGAMLFFL